VPLCIDDTVVAQYDPGLDVAPTSSPRPFLHPVRTLGGLTVTDAHPADHDWHLGIGVAVQDVAGWNLWGGRTYVRGSGYTWRHDHGRIEHVGWADRGPGRLAADLRWLDPADRVLMHERRTLRWGRPAEPEFTAWLLDFEFTLTPPGGEPVKLGSPGSNGREGGGYGGFFWRLPPVDELDVCTPHARGELAVHGSVAPWLCARPRIGADRATLLVQPLDPVSAADPWFVRVAGYPGLGAALAWDEPATVEPDRPLHRGYRLVIADGNADPEVLVALTVRAGPTS
jgi:hypothetical protein